MNIEKRSAPGPSGAQEGPGRKPVIVYIMILFIAAFLLMALSFFMHQRSNTEALGQLQSSVSAMQEMQETQEHVLELQKQLARANETIQELSELQGAIEQAEKNTELTKTQLETTRQAMDAFWQANEAYVLGDLETCRDILQEQIWNHEPSWEGYLSEQAAERYEEICKALESLPENSVNP